MCKCLTHCKYTCFNIICCFKIVHIKTYLVTLNTLSKRTQRSTETPSGGIISVLVKIISPMLPITTKQSKRLNNETK